LLATPALAGDKAPVFVESNAVKDKPAIALKPDKAYILLRTDAAMPLYLMKVPTAADQAIYDKLRADAFAEAHEKYLKKLAKYERCQGGGRQDAGARPVPEKPEEPTESNFEFTPFPLLAGFTMGPTNRFAKGDGRRLDLSPGADAGRVSHLWADRRGTGAAMGSCYCMGSVKFEVRAGR
jgi:hypothetical protein